MASAKQIVALLNSHVQGDEEQFLSIALQVAAGEARQGRPETADELKRLVQKAREPSTRTGWWSSGDSARAAEGRIGRASGGRLSGHKACRYGLGRCHPTRLLRLLKQQNGRAKLRDHGQKPSAHLLLIGPPGTGKTMTASALAESLGFRCSPFDSIRCSPATWEKRRRS